MYEITVKLEDRVIERVVSEKKRITIGRAAENDIVLENRGVSRKHVTIEFNGTTFVIIDNETLNGTFVNNRKIREQVLQDKDIIGIGKYTLEFHSKHVSTDSTMSVRLVSTHPGAELVGVENVEFETYPIAKNVVEVGTAKYADVHVKGWWLSGVHVRIVRTDRDYELRVCGKHCLTSVNGVKTTWRLLQDGDLIQIGRSEFRFQAV